MTSPLLELPGAVPPPDGSPDSGVAWHHGDPLGEQRAAERDVAVVDRSHREVLAVPGEDRLSWLHTITSQHLLALGEGEHTEALVLDLRGHVEHHAVVSHVHDTVWLDTDPGRAQGLLAYLSSMVFWSKVAPRDATSELAVLSLLGPRLADGAVLDALGMDALPAELTAVPAAGGGFVRRMPGAPAGQIELDLLVPRAESAGWRSRLTQAGVRAAGVWAYEAHRVATLRPRLGVDTDERTIPHEVGWIGGPSEGAVHLDKGCYRRQETVARVHNLGKPPRMLVLLHLDGSVERPSTGDPVLAGGRAVGRLGTVVDHVDLGPVALALVKRGLPAETPLTTGPEAAVAAVIDADCLPATDHVGAGRLAVERLRGGAR